MSGAVSATLLAWDEEARHVTNIELLTTREHVPSSSGKWFVDFLDGRAGSLTQCRAYGYPWKSTS